MKREFLQLAHVFDPKKHQINGWLVSEKLDGMRAFWDGGVSRGVLAAEVPWANTDRKSHLVDAPVATGLWSRYGNVIRAPDWWLDELPPFQLDGELWMGRGKFQHLVSVTKSFNGDLGWRDVQYLAFDCPSFQHVFADGVINVTNFNKKLVNCVEWALARAKEQPPSKIHLSFEATYHYLSRVLTESFHCLAHEQERLPFATQEAAARVEQKLLEVLDNGGEGLILRNHVSIWTPGRVHTCLKYKPYEDDEGMVIGYTWGRQTDKGSKLLGLMGALVLRLKNGKTLELSGFTDQERYLRCLNPAHDQEGIINPGQPVSEHWTNPTFPIGSQVTYKYRELTIDGIPKEARYARRRPAGT